MPQDVFLLNKILIQNEKILNINSIIVEKIAETLMVQITVDSVNQLIVETTYHWLQIHRHEHICTKTKTIETIF